MTNDSRAADALAKAASPRPIERVTTDDFRRQLLGQLANVACGNASAEETVAYFLDLIGNTKVAAIDATLAEEIRKLRLYLGHTQYLLSNEKAVNAPLPPEGMVVPVEPTEAMLEAAEMAYRKHHAEWIETGSGTVRGLLYRAVKAALASAPVSGVAGEGT